ncbi:hypothetical protein LUZ60_013209 [Juncus effusus]|nr:hypothetical protein LUZ60_013209 [Juncus effusus]
MGAAPSKIDEDKSLALCQERKRFVREALDGRCSLAATHFSYVESLRNTGVALRNFAQSDAPPNEPSLYTASSSEIRDLNSRIPKPGSQFPDLSPEMSKQDSCSPISPRLHINHMKAARILSKTVQEKLPVSMKATLESSVETEIVNYEEDPLPPAGTWDYFGLFHPTEDQYTLEQESQSHTIDHTEEIRRVRQEEGIPELEEEEQEQEQEQEERELQEEELEELEELEKLGEEKEKVKNGDLSGDEFEGTEEEDEFDDESSKEPLVRMFENRNFNNLEANRDGDLNNNLEDLGSDTEGQIGQSGRKENNYESDESRTGTPPAQMLRNPNFNRNVENFSSDTSVHNLKTEKYNNKNNNVHEKEEIENKSGAEMLGNPNLMMNHDVASIEDLGSVVNGNNNNSNDNNNMRKNNERDLFSCMKEIEELFRKAAESGKEVPRMLEADKVNFRPLLPNERGTPNFIMSFFGCCGPDTPQPQPSVSAPVVEVNYLMWHRSVSSLSSSSRNPIEEVNRDNMEFHTVGGVYMNSGSHASTLDRLYAWERKLYDEVKASGAIRRDYDLKCKLLRHQESRGETQNRIDKTRSCVKDLHSRIRVAIQRIDKISKTIEEIRDKELQPQLEELIEGLSRMWGVMLECHKQQLDLILMTSSNGSAKFSIRPESQSQATLTLVNELNHLCSNFTKWISAHKSYLKSIDKWVHKCISPLQQNPKRKNKRQNVSLRSYGPPPIFVTCEEWLKLLEGLPTNEVVNAIKELSSVTTHFLPRQEKRSKGFKSSLLRAGNGDSNNEMNGRSNGSLVETSLNCDSLQSRLAVFLEKLVNFADVSLNNYESLQQSISEARDEYMKDHHRQ